MCFASFKVRVSTVVCHSWFSICAGVYITGLRSLNTKYEYLTLYLANYFSSLVSETN